MTHDDIIRMAREAGYGDAMADLHAFALERFAALVAAAVAPVCGECGKSSAEGWALYCVRCCEGSLVKAAVAEEREACAQICYARCPMDGTVSVEVELARAIRARGET